MKKIDFKGLGLFFLTTCITTYSWSQSNVLPASKDALPDNSTALIPAKEDIRPGNSNEKVIRAFQKNFKTVQSPHWSINTKEYVASFKLEGRYALAFFNKAGRQECTIYYGSAKELPTREKEIIRYNYSGYDITATQEIDHRLGHAWIVVVENCNSIKKVKIQDGEFYELEHLNRVK